MPKPTLVGLTYSPWTQRARWALDHHRLGYDFEPYLPVVGEPLLRLRARKLSGRVSVPVLLTPHGSITDSLAIARHADSVGSGERLVDGHEAAVARFVDLAEKALHAARALVLRAVDQNPLAQEESVSLPLPSALKRPVARFGTWALATKWSARMSEEEGESRVASVLEELRRALGGKPYLDGSFSFADMAMAGVVQSIAPVDDRFIRLAPGTRQSWSRPTLARRFSDMVEWRDALFEKHFARSAA